MWPKGQATTVMSSYKGFASDPGTEKMSNQPIIGTIITLLNYGLIMA